MFYIKIPLASGISIQAEIRSDNVITRCRCCGDEMPVDLADVFSYGEGNLENINLLCPACAAILLERVRVS